MPDGKTTVEVGIPGLKIKHTPSSTTRSYKYLCEVAFDSEDDAKHLRALVEDVVSERGGKMVQSSFETVETNK